MSGFSVLVINTWPGGAEDASALVRNLGYSFKLAHAPEGWEHSLGQGANFLIDQRGRIVFRPHFNGPGDMKTADRLIAGLLRHEHRPKSRRRDRIPAGNAGVTGS
jgi:hypothetical protein